MKKNLLLVLATALFVIGCGKEEPKVIKVQMEPAWIDYYTDVAQAIEAKYEGWTVEFVEAYPWDHITTINNTSVTNEDVADVFHIGPLQRYDLQKSNALAKVPMAEISADLNWKNYNRKTGSILGDEDGTYWGVPSNIESYVVFVNKSHLAEALDIAKENLDLSAITKENPIEIFDSSKAKGDYYIDGLKYTANKNHEGWGTFVYSTGDSDFKYLYKDEAGNLRSEVSKDWDDLEEKEQAYFEFLYEYWKYHDQTVENAPDAAWDDANFGKWIEDGYRGDDEINKLALVFENSGFAPKNMDVLGDDFGVLPINAVTVSGNALSHFAAGWALGINARNENDPERMSISVDIIKEILSKDRAAAYFNDVGRVFPHMTVEEYANVEGIDEKDLELIQTMVNSWESSSIRPNISEINPLQVILDDTIQSFSTEGSKPTSAQEAYEKIQIAVKSEFLKN